jgi:hypothetical protein
MDDADDDEDPDFCRMRIKLAETLKAELKSDLSEIKAVLNALRGQATQPPPTSNSTSPNSNPAHTPQQKPKRTKKISRSKLENDFNVSLLD